MCVYTHVFHVFFISSSVDRYLGCFHVLVIESSAAVKIEVHICFLIRVFVFSRYMSRGGSAGSYFFSIVSAPV